MSQAISNARQQAIYDERRTHQRTTFIADIGFSSDSNFYTGFTRDISEGGVFVATYNVFPVGTVMELELQVPDTGAPIQVKGEVRWSAEANEDSDGHPGVGLRFLDLSEADRRRIDRFVSVRDSIFFDDE